MTQWSAKPNPMRWVPLAAGTDAKRWSAAAGPGVVAIQQHINSLFGLQDDYFDCVVLNNVSYALEDPVVCLRQTWRVLKPGGEVRISGPRKDTNLNRLFPQIRRDLQSKGLFDDLRDDYRRVEDINKHRLAPMLFRWTVDDVKQQLRDAGFLEPYYATEKAYAGQSMIVCARKEYASSGWSATPILAFSAVAGNTGVRHPYGLSRYRMPAARSSFLKPRRRSPCDERAELGVGDSLFDLGGSRRRSGR